MLRYTVQPLAVPLCVRSTALCSHARARLGDTRRPYTPITPWRLEGPFAQENVPGAHAALQAAAAQAAELRAAVAARDAELASRGAALRQLASECAAAQEQARLRMQPSSGPHMGIASLPHFGRPAGHAHSNELFALLDRGQAAQEPPLRCPVCHPMPAGTAMHEEYCQTLQTL